MCPGHLPTGRSQDNSYSHKGNGNFVSGMFLWACFLRPWIWASAKSFVLEWTARLQFVNTSVHFLRVLLKFSSLGFALLAYPASPPQDNILLCSQAVLIWWRVSFHLDLDSDSLYYQRQELLLAKPSHRLSSLILTFLGILSFYTFHIHIVYFVCLINYSCTDYFWLS